MHFQIEKSQIINLIQFEIPSAALSRPFGNQFIISLAMSHFRIEMFLLQLKLYNMTLSALYKQENKNEEAVD